VSRLEGPIAIREPIVGRLYRKMQRYHHPFVAWFLVDDGHEAKRSKQIDDGSILLYVGKLEQRKGLSAKMFQHDGEMLIVYSESVWEILEEIP
jgi:hypothetical protein